MKKGFTLVELLSVIVILGVIAVIIIPKVTNSLKESEEKTNIASAKGLLKAAQYKYQDNELKGIEENITINYKTGQNIDKLEYSGEKPESGKIQVTSEGRISMAVKIKDKCYTKTFGSEDIKVQEYNSETCDIPESLENDSWKMIQTAIRNNNADIYNVGDTKNISLNGNVYTIRLINKTYEGCDSVENNFSQTACGFVFEFVESITSNSMTSNSMNTGGFPNTIIYDLLRNDIYESLPVDLKSVIANTYIVHGHGSAQGEDNSITTDKLYLPSVKEIYGNNCYGLTNICNSDTASDYTKELEYYKYNDNQNERKKHNTQSNSSLNWWLRTASKSDSNGFIYVDLNGNPGSAWPSSTYYIAPMFRIE